MTTPAPFAPSYTRVETDEEFEQLCQRLIADARPFGFDIETSYDGDPYEEKQLHPDDDEQFVCGLSLCNSPSWAKYAALRHDDGDNLDNTRAAAAFWSLLQTGLGVAHGLKFELRCLARWFAEKLSDHPLLGKQVREAVLTPGGQCGYFPYRSCTMLESYAEGDNPSHALKLITNLNFGHNQQEIAALFEAVLGSKMTAKQKSVMRFSSLPSRDQRVIDYACEDSLWALAHHYRRYAKVKDTFIYQLEMAILPIVCQMEDEGIYYDWNFYREAAYRAQLFQDRLATEVNNDLTTLVQAKDPAEPPVSINLNSFKQKGEVLYTKLGLSTRIRTDTGALSTGKLALKGLASQYPVVRKMLNWTSLFKLRGTYLDKYERNFSYAPDRRAHPSWLQHGVPAGRFAAANPPVQQSPKKYRFVLNDGTEFVLNFRDGIAAPKGWYIVGFDYAQQEVRVLAGEAGEDALVDAFARGVDIHKFTASMMYGKSMDDVTPEERDLGKTLGLALGYQMGVSGLAERLVVSKDEAQRLFDLYFSTFPKIKGYMERTIAGARARGYIITRFGRKVLTPDLNHPERWRAAEAERTAGNIPIQGPGTGDYPKIAMVRADKALAAAGLKDKVRLFLNMHDALEWYARDDVPPALVIRVLQAAVVFPVEGWPPMVAEWHVGRSWGQVQEVELQANGSIRLKPKKAKPVVVESDGDPDEPEIAPVQLPAAGLPAGTGGPAGAPVAAMAPAAAAPASPLPLPGATTNATGRTVWVTLNQMPTSHGWAQFAQAFGPGTGINMVILRTPDGTIPLHGCAADPAYEPQIALCFGSAAVQYSPDSVDARQLAAGLAL